MSYGYGKGIVGITPFDDGPIKYKVTLTSINGPNAVSISNEIQENPILIAVDDWPLIVAAVNKMIALDREKKGNG